MQEGIVSRGRDGQVAGVAVARGRTADGHGESEGVVGRSGMTDGDGNGG